MITSTNQAGGYSCVVSNAACSWDVVDTYPADPAESTNAILAVTVGPLQFIGTQLVSLTAGVGSNVTFNVIAYGASPLVFQWYYNNAPAGSPAAGTNGSAYILTNVQTSQSGNYSVRVTNGYGNVTSADAVLTVVVTPALTLQLLAGGPQLSLSGLVNSNFVVEYSPEVLGARWTNLLSLSNLTSSPYLFLDPAGATQRTRFYRVFMQ